MPSSAKIQKEDIINAAYEIAKEKGIEAINAREVARNLKCSVQPIFYQFSNMEELKKQVLNKIHETYKQYMLQGTNEEKAYKATGNLYVKFARDYPEFFKMIFMKETTLQPEQFLGADTITEEVIEQGRKFTGFSYEEQKEFHIKVWIFTHGIATLVATKTVQFTDEEIDELITTSVRQMIIGYKIEKGESK